MLHANQGFQSGEMLILFQIGLFTWLEETHVSLERKPSMLEGGYLEYCSPMNIELLFERNTACLWGFSGGRKATFVPKNVYSWIEETHVSLKRKPSTLEGVASSTLLFCENWVTFWKEHCLPSRVLRWRNAHFVSNQPTQLNWKNPFISWKKTIYFRRWSI
jgi:hypothetical protein